MFYAIIIVVLYKCKLGTLVLRLRLVLDKPVGGTIVQLLHFSFTGEIYYSVIKVSNLVLVICFSSRIY